MTKLFFSFLLLGLNCFTEPKEIHINTADGLTIYGDLYLQDEKGVTILLFHQGGSNAQAEYQSIIPRLLKKGYNILAIDQRQGGQIYGKYNRTVAEIPNNEFGYCDALADLEGALEYLLKNDFSGKKILWGSSYSASLAIQLASKHAENIAGVLAFSPASGGPMKACRPDPFFENLKLPLLLLRPKKEMEIESVKNQLELAQKFGHQTYITEIGTHGSSMLVADRAGGEVGKNWEIVFNFLKNLDK